MAEYGLAVYIVLRVQRIDWAEYILQVVPANDNKTEKKKDLINVNNSLYVRIKYI